MSAEMDNDSGHTVRKTMVHIRQGFMFAILNPKAIMFFVSLFPQFISGQTMDLINIGAIYLPIWIIAYLCFMIYTMGGITVMKIFGRSTYVAKVFGLLIVAAGGALAYF